MHTSGLACETSSSPACLSKLTVLGLVYCKRSLTHHPSSQGWAPTIPVLKAGHPPSQFSRLGTHHPSSQGWAPTIPVLKAGYPPSLCSRLGTHHPSSQGWVPTIPVLKAGRPPSQFSRLGTHHPCAQGWAPTIPVLKAGCPPSQFSRLGAHHPSSQCWAPTIPVLKAGHPAVLVILCLRVCTVRVWCLGSEFPFFSSSTTNLLYTCIFMYIHVYICLHSVTGSTEATAELPTLPADGLGHSCRYGGERLGQSLVHNRN